MLLSGFGNYPKTEAPLHRARGDVQVQEVVANHASLIARGNGRSYGDSALNADATLSLLRHDRILAFDEASGRITCEAGVMLADLLALYVPRGWFVPVTPGTKFVTIGGMVASDVHGKNHHRAGSFGNHVEELVVMLANGRVVNCSPTQWPELFAATCGGMGLTGVILSVTFRMMPIETAYIRQQTVRTKNLAETMEVLAGATDATYAVAWIDCLARGSKLGRSVVYLGEHARAGEIAFFGDALALPPRKTRKVPFNFPSFSLNRWSIRAFNALYYARAEDGTALVDYEQFFYPLDAVLEWNRIYGKRGFVQYQCVLPLDVSAQGLTLLLQHVSKAGLGSFLAVLKLLGPGNSYLSFPMEGYTLALDFPASGRVFKLLEKLDTIVASHGGRIYLAKDARMPAAMLQHYTGLDAFRALRHQFDPEGKFSSLQSQRLGL